MTGSEPCVTSKLAKLNAHQQTPLTPNVCQSSLHALENDPSRMCAHSPLDEHPQMTDAGGSWPCCHHKHPWAEVCTYAGERHPLAPVACWTLPVSVRRTGASQFDMESPSTKTPSTVTRCMVA